jgi:dihydrofolate reductase
MMAELIYGVIMSLDGYIADEEGNFDWAEPDEEVHSFINELERPVGTYLYGRGMYETMAVWETFPTHDLPPYIAAFAEIWRAADKVIYSSRLAGVSTSKTRIERSFEPEAVRRMKASSPRDIAIAGPTLAAQAFMAGLVDVCHLFVSPVLVGGGKKALPGGLRLNLVLQDERRFTNGTVFLHYRSAGHPTT